MRIYLCRHAHAVDEGPRLDDDSRYLTTKGRQVARAVGTKLRERGVELDAVLTSPLVRAVQTAELVAERLGFLGEIEALPQLAPGIPSRLVAAELPARGVSVGVFGHSPGISDLGAFLCSRPSFPGLKPGHCAVIEDGKPVFWVDPETLQLERLLLA